MAMHSSNNTVHGKMEYENSPVYVYVTYVMAGLALVGIILFIITIVQKRKQQKLLKAILSTLSFIVPNEENNQPKSSKMDDGCYQEIPINHNNPKMTSIQNAAYMRSNDSFLITNKKPDLQEKSLNEDKQNKNVTKPVSSETNLTDTQTTNDVIIDGTSDKVDRSKIYSVVKKDWNTRL